MNLENLNLHDDGPQGPDVIYEFQGAYRFLSNFHECDFEWSGQVWHSSEAAYQAAKFHKRHWPDMAMLSPAQAKKQGQMAPIDPNHWEGIKVAVMREIILMKFTQNPDLLDKLLATDHAILQEGNRWKDTFWGICPPGSDTGRNLLGIILMSVRDDLRKLQATLSEPLSKVL